MGEIKTKRGGARAGAGRPRTAPDSVNICLRVPTTIRDKAKILADSKNKTVTQLFIEMVERG